MRPAINAIAPEAVERVRKGIRRLVERSGSLEGDCGEGVGVHSGGRACGCRGAGARSTLRRLQPLHGLQDVPELPALRKGRDLQREELAGGVAGEGDGDVARRVGNGRCGWRRSGCARVLKTEEPGGARRGPVKRVRVCQQ